MREVSKTKVLNFTGLSLLMILCLAMFAQRKVTIVTWFILGLVCLQCFFKWRQGILLVFIWLNVEGFLRLWTGGDIIVFFFKDIMFLAIYISFLLEKFFFREKPPIPHSISLPLICLFGLSLIQLLNPNLHSALVGLVGLKTLFFYAPLFYISFQLFDSKERLLQFCFILMLMAIPICLYSLVQFLLGPAYYRSLGEAFQPWIVFGERATLSFSPPSTFIFVSIFGSYLLFMTFFGISLVSARLAGQRKLICWTSFISILVALIITTRRLTMALVVAGVPTMLLLQKRMRPFVYFITVSLSISFISLYFIPGVYDLFLGRTFYMLAHPYETVYLERIVGVLQWHAPIMLSSAFIGNGIGMGTLGRRYIWTAGAPMEGLESQYAKIWYELSIWGFLIFIWLLVRLVRTSWRIYRRLDDPDLKWLSLGIFMYQCAIVIAGTITHILDMPINAVYLWFFSGALFKLPLFAEKQLQPQESQ